MIKPSNTTTVLRFFKEGSTSLDYDAILTLTWLTKSVVFVSGFKGVVSRKSLNELITYFVDNNIEYVLADRSPLHSLAMSVQTEEGLYRIKVKDLARRMLPNKPS